MAIVRNAVEGGEVAPNEDRPIALLREGEHGVVGAGAGVEARVQTTIGVGAHDAVTACPVVGGEEAAHDGLAIGLYADRGHGVVRSGTTEVVTRVQGAITVQPR